MKQVILYELVKDEQLPFVTFHLNENAEIVFEGNEAFIGHFIKNGITDYSTEPRGIVMPTDSDKFLEQLQYNYRTGYLTATKPSDA